MSREAEGLGARPRGHVRVRVRTELNSVRDEFHPEIWVKSSM